VLHTFSHLDRYLLKAQVNPGTFGSLSNLAVLRIGMHIASIHHNEDVTWLACCWLATSRYSGLVLKYNHSTRSIEYIYVFVLTSSMTFWHRDFSKFPRDNFSNSWQRLNIE
jgi:hypothetical protein